MTTGCPAGDSAGHLVTDYLGLCEARQLAAAARLLATDPVIVFPGGVRYQRLEDMVADAAGRYRWVRKERQPPVVAAVDGGSWLVLSTGTLTGEASDGTAFSGVRYLDLFIVRDGRICEQHVFNDLAEAGIVAARRRPVGDGSSDLDSAGPVSTIQGVPSSETPYHRMNQ